MSIKTSKKFDWKPEYSVGVKSIDEQHQYFFKLMNSLHELSELSDASSDKLREVINDLNQYAKFHFCTEEKFFEELKYEGAKPHCAAHSNYFIKVKDFTKKLESPDSDLKKISEDLAEFAADWLITHILIDDKKYATCFQNHGLV